MVHETGRRNGLMIFSPGDDSRPPLLHVTIAVPKPTDEQERIPMDDMIDKATIRARIAAGEDLHTIAETPDIPYARVRATKAGMTRGHGTDDGSMALDRAAAWHPTDPVTHATVSEEEPPVSGEDQGYSGLTKPPAGEFLGALLDQADAILGQIRTAHQGLTLPAYQVDAARTLNRAGTAQDALANYALGIASEAGELVNLLKKHLYHGHALDLEAVAEEMGDVLWYLAALATTLDRDLGDLAAANLAKLHRRYPGGFDPVRSQNREER